MFSERILPYQEQSYGSGLLWLTRTNCFVYQSMMIVLLSLTAFATNYFVYQYPGNVYLPSANLVAGLRLPLIYAGFYLLYGQTGKMTQITKEVVYFLGVVVLIGFATNAAQYTPFPTIDHHILAVESLLKIHTSEILIWTHSHPLIKFCLEVVYASLQHQLYLIPLVVIAIGRTDLIREHYFLLVTTTLIGFTFYYFFPTMAPASVINSPYFNESQHATHIKFYQLHHHIQPETIDGGLIALPSFHVIWAWLCLYLLRGWPIAFGLLLPVNLLVTVSCVLLGWHYFMDILGAVAVIIFAHCLYGFTGLTVPHQD